MAKENDSKTITIQSQFTHSFLRLAEMAEVNHYHDNVHPWKKKVVGRLAMTSGKQLVQNASSPPYW